MLSTLFIQITEDPNQVNVHQFYPELEHQFMKDHQTQGDGQQVSSPIITFICLYACLICSYGSVLGQRRLG